VFDLPSTAPQTTLEDQLREHDLLRREHERPVKVYQLAAHVAATGFRRFFGARLRLLKAPNTRRPAEIVQPRTSYDPCYLLLKISTKHECNFFMNRSSSLYCIIVVLCFNRWKYLLSMPSRSPARTRV
jgi:hypothetical protein